MKIIPRIGFDKIKFGMSIDEVISIFGKPELVEEDKYTNNPDDLYKTLWYFSNTLSFIFNKEDNFRLGTISSFSTSHTLFGKKLIGLNLNSILTTSTLSSEAPKVESWKNEDHEELKCLDYDRLGLIFWFKENILFKIECSYLFDDDNETILWP